MLPFNELIKSEKPVLVDFTASWCGPCQMMSPILDEVADKKSEQVKVVKVDVDKNPQAAAAYEIKGVPTLMIFKEGEILWRQSGVVPAQQLEHVIDQIA